MSVITRSIWGAKAGRGDAAARGLGLVVIHHFASPDIAPSATQSKETEAMRGVERSHLGRGWQGIGYNFVIFGSGRVYEGRGWGRVGAHAPGANSKSVGICFGWDGQARGLTPGAVQAAHELLREGITLGWLAPELEIRGHRFYSQTTCPGDRIFAALEQLRPGAAPPVEEPANDRPQIGDRRWSGALGDYVVLASFTSDDDWRFVQAKHLKAIGKAATTPWSKMPMGPPDG